MRLGNDMSLPPPASTAPPRILLLEDHMVIMLQAEDVLRSGGYLVTTAANATAAHQALENFEIDAAVLNINLSGDISFSVADALVRRGIPFLFTSGHSPAVVPERLRAVPLIQKPYMPSELLAGVTVLMLGKEDARTGDGRVSGR